MPHFLAKPARGNKRDFFFSSYWVTTMNQQYMLQALEASHQALPDCQPNPTSGMCFGEER